MTNNNNDVQLLCELCKTVVDYITSDGNTAILRNILHKMILVTSEHDQDELIDETYEYITEHNKFPSILDIDPNAKLYRCNYIDAVKLINESFVDSDDSDDSEDSEYDNISPKIVFTDFICLKSFNKVVTRNLFNKVKIKKIKTIPYKFHVNTLNNLQ
jgi:hypothetical protein